jgi:hypothetical protein
MYRTLRIDFEFATTTKLDEKALKIDSQADRCDERLKRRPTQSDRERTTVKSFIT